MFFKLQFVLKFDYFITIKYVVDCMTRCTAELPFRWNFGNARIMVEP